MSRKRTQPKPWKHLDATPLFDQTNRTPGAIGEDAVDGGPDDHALTLLERGAASNIINFGSGVSF